MNFDWQMTIVVSVVVYAVIHVIKSLCFGDKKSKCHDCANKCNNFKPDNFINIKVEK